jgi:MoaA/NifB/PqqE/SkfB family radical SAM enzyme
MAMADTDMFSNISCVYKDAFGFRPSVSWMKVFSELTHEEKVGLYNSFVDITVDSIITESRRQHGRIVHFEKMIEDTIAAGADTRLSAIRWIVQSYEDEIGAQKEAGYACFILDIPYTYEAEIAAAMGWSS